MDSFTGRFRDECLNENYALAREGLMSAKRESVQTAQELVLGDERQFDEYRQRPLHLEHSTLRCRRSKLHS